MLQGRIYRREGDIVELGRSVLEKMEAFSFS